MDELPFSAVLARLTENEKECLRRRLRHQTAKEMAIDLGISPHAVEKRLKMARAKLGVSSSLAAARLLDAAERYGPAVPPPADLSPALETTDKVGAGPDLGFGRLTTGVLLMLFATLLLLLQSAAPTSEGTTIDERGRPVPTRKTDPDEVAAFLGWSFEAKDADRSGFLNPVEASRMEPRDAQRDSALPPAPPAGRPDPAAERKWMVKLDGGRDGRVSRAEYVSYMLPWILWQGVPADWRRWAKRPG